MTVPAPRRRMRFAVFLAAGLAVTVLAAGIVSTFVSSEPDGLERVALDEGFAATADDHEFAGGPVAGYAVRGVDDERLSTGFAGVLGVALVFAVTGGALVVLRRSRRRVAAG